MKAGQSYLTKSGRSVSIVEEKNDSRGYECAKGDDGIWRYNRDQDRGRVTGSEPECPDNLTPEYEILSRNPFREVFNSNSVTIQSLRVSIDDVDYIRFGAFDGKTYIGTIDIRDMGEGIASFRQFFVLPQHRRKGAGTRLLIAAISAALGWGSKSIQCEVRKINMPAIRYYQKQGFSIHRDDASAWTMALELKYYGKSTTRES